jgi:hypothetical protein
MSTHKNECPVAAGQVVKTLTKRSANFSAKSTATEAQIQRLLWLIAARITTVASDGYAHHGVALYTLVSAPKGGAA